jgi:hypothetical protein
LAQAAPYVQRRWKDLAPRNQVHRHRAMRDRGDAYVSILWFYLPARYMEEAN